MFEETVACSGFAALSINPKLLDGVSRLGYLNPTPIQARAIPLMLQGLDILGQAQTGTGKTAAFGLPLLDGVDASSTDTQALVLTPTRELALQVADALQQLASGLSGVRAVPVYGGQDYGKQLRAFRRGAHIVVGTPGRVMDHLRRGSLKLDGLKTLVLDEADEMLNMGFIEDIEWILGQCPDERQTALFSATLPSRIRLIAARHMQDPRHVRVEKRSSSAPKTIQQRHWLVRRLPRIDALCRILEAEPLDAALVFVRTRTAAAELAEQLAARGLNASALHGEMSQATRERTVARLKAGQTDILVATDVAARGLDVDRFSHVINHDMPTDGESYLHRIGRTGRAGRKGQAISFVTPRERHLIRTIERKTGQTIEPMELPSAAQINKRRVETFKQQVQDSVARAGLEPFLGILTELATEMSLDPLQMAAALAKKAQGTQPLLVSEPPPPARKPRPRRADDRPSRPRRADDRPSRPRHAEDRPSPTRGTRLDDAGRGASRRARHGGGAHEPGMARYRLAVGREHGVSATHIVGAITNMSGLRGHHIGRITINQDHTLVDLPQRLSPKMFHKLRQIRIYKARLELRLDQPDSPPRSGRKATGRGPEPAWPVIPAAPRHAPRSPKQTPRRAAGKR